MTTRTLIESSAHRRVYQTAVPSRHNPNISLPRREVEVLCCREWLPCNGFTSTCSHCGSDFNWSGSKLAPRSQWGEETGEHWSECY